MMRTSRRVVRRVRRFRNVDVVHDGGRFVQSMTWRPAMLKRENQCFRVSSFLVLVCGAMCGAARGDCEPSWHPLVSGGQTGVDNDVRAMTVWNNELIVGGYFTTAGGQ